MPNRALCCIKARSVSPVNVIFFGLYLIQDSRIIWVKWLFGPNWVKVYTNRPFLGRKTSLQLYFEAPTRFDRIPHKSIRQTLPIFWKFSHRQASNSSLFASFEKYQQLPHYKFQYFLRHQKNLKFRHKIFYSVLSRGIINTENLRLKIKWYPSLIDRNNYHQTALVWVEFRIWLVDIVRPKCKVCIANLVYRNEISQG